MKKVLTSTLVKIAVVAGLLTAAAFFVCEVDYGLTPLPGKLALTVRFLNEPPEDTEGIYLMVAPDFPPHAINEVYHSPNSLPIHQDTVYTEMALPYGHYDALALWWYSKKTETNLADVLAIPIDIGTEFRPLGFNITREDPVFDLELIANWRKVDRDAAIEGDIHFNGPFPANTEAVAVAAFKRKPEKSVDYLIQLKSLDFSIDEGENPYHFRLPVRSGSVNFIAVFWLPSRAALTAFQTVGIYQDPEHPGQAGSLSLDSGETATGIDIFADWSNIEE